MRLIKKIKGVFLMFSKMDLLSEYFYNEYDRLESDLRYLESKISSGRYFVQELQELERKKIEFDTFKKFRNNVNYILSVSDHDQEDIKKIV